MVWVFLALVFVDIGLIFDRMDDVSFIKIQYRFIGALVFGLIAGIIIWTSNTNRSGTMPLGCSVELRDNSNFNRGVKN